MDKHKGRVCVIMQPTYLPWCGYLDLLDQSDVFVFLDNVQFAKRSWQQRNRIRTSRGLEWLTVPVRVKGRYHQLIREVEVLPNKFPMSHIKAIELNYRRAPFLQRYWTDLRQILKEPPPLLCDLNISLIHWISTVLGMNVCVEKASTLQGSGRRTELLVDLCKRVDADIYLSPRGSLDYLKSDYMMFRDNNLRVAIHNYVHPVYRQVFTPFIPFASVIDLIFNQGPCALEIIRSGRQESTALKDLLEVES